MATGADDFLEATAASNTAEILRVQEGDAEDIVRRKKLLQQLLEATDASFKACMARCSTQSILSNCMRKINLHWAVADRELWKKRNLDGDWFPEVELYMEEDPSISFKVHELTFYSACDFYRQLVLFEHGRDKASGEGDGASAAAAASPGKSGGGSRGNLPRRYQIPASVTKDPR